MGFSAQLAASSRHSNRYISTRGFAKATRLHRPDVLVSDLFRGRYEAAHMSGRKHGRLEPLELLFAIEKRTPHAPLVKSADQSGYLIPLLDLTEQAIAGDARHLAFDYFSMNRRSWILLEKLLTDLRADLTMLSQATGEDLLAEDQLSVRMVPAYLFQTIGAQARTGGHAPAGIDRRGAASVDTMIGEHGSAELEQVKGDVEQVALDDAASNADELTGAGSEDEVASDDEDVVLMNAILDHAPTPRTVPREHMPEVVKAMRTTPYEQMPQSSQAMYRMLQANGADMGSTGLRGGLGKMSEMIGHLTREQQDAFLQTTDLSQALKILNEANGQAESAPEKKTGSKKNKNKNRNRKLRQKAKRATPDVETVGEAAGELQVMSKPNGMANKSTAAKTAKDIDIAPVRVPADRYGNMDVASPEYAEAKRRGVMMFKGEVRHFTGTRHTEMDVSDVFDMLRDRPLEQMKFAREILGAERLDQVVGGDFSKMLELADSLNPRELE